MAVEYTRWGIKEIAAAFDWSAKHVRDRIIKRPDFPKPVVSVSAKRRWWRAEDVQRWAAKA